MEYIFIVNPQARSGMGKMIWNRLEPELKKQRIVYQVYMTEAAGHACKISRHITEDGKEHTLVVLGGDGTVNEVLNGMLDVSKVTLGYIPIGSSNDFARGMQLPKNPKEALEVILSGKQILRMDVGVITRRGKQRRFAVSAGIGFDAAVCHEVCVSPWKRILNKLKLGKLSYAVVALDRLLKDTPVRTVISTDSEGEKVYDKLFFAAAMNQRYEGGGFCFCPHASPGDSMLDIIIVSDLSKLKMLCLLPTAFRGWHVRFKGITILRCKQIAVETEKPLPIHTDGEPVFLSDKIEVCLLPDKLRVITT